MRSRHLASSLYEKLYIIDVNLQRSQLTVAQRIQLSLKKKPILQELANKNSQINLRRGKNNAGHSNVQFCTLGRVNEKIAKDSGVSARQVSKVETILEKADPKLRDRITTINRVCLFSFLDLQEVLLTYQTLQ